MSAPNFAYDHRCIVVSNDDWDMGNVPPIKDSNYDYDRNYPSKELKVSNDFRFWDIIITAGYYADSCIDYMRNESLIEDELGACHYYETKKEFFDAVRKEFPQYKLSDYRLNKICGKVSDFKNLDYYIDNAYEVISNYLAELEEVKVNQYLDGLMKSYGYEEYVCVAISSNGEGFYRKKMQQTA